jgi:hypothetical protein
MKISSHYNHSIGQIRADKLLMHIVCYETATHLHDTAEAYCVSITAESVSISAMALIPYTVPRKECAT